MNLVKWEIWLKSFPRLSDMNEDGSCKLDSMTTEQIRKRSILPGLISYLVFLVASVVLSVWLTAAIILGSIELWERL